MIDPDPTADPTTAPTTGPRDRAVLLSPGASISPDTDVTGDLARIPAGVSATPSTPDPGALVAGNRVSTGTELQTE